MSQLRFNHVFFFLMLLAALAAFVIPQRISSPAQGQLQALFTPISRPMNSLAGWMHDRAVHAPPPRDDGSPDHPRTADELIRENTDLRQQNLTLSGQLAKLQELDADRARLGDLRDRCIPATVVGRDSSLRDSLLISSGSLQGLSDGMAVLSPDGDGLVGRLDKVGAASARVRLIYDKGNKVSVSFARFVSDGHGGVVGKSISYPSSVAVGLGDGQLAVEFEKWDKMKDIFQVNDWVLLDDPDWPKGVTHYRVGLVSAVQPQPRAPGFGEILIQSRVDVGQLKQVMVLTK